jgi:hypothetical protein
VGGRNNHGVIFVSHGKIPGGVPDGLFVKTQIYISLLFGRLLPVPQNKVNRAVRARRNVKAPEHSHPPETVILAEFQTGFPAGQGRDEEKKEYECGQYFLFHASLTYYRPFMEKEKERVQEQELGFKPAFKGRFSSPVLFSEIPWWRGQSVWDRS